MSPTNRAGRRAVKSVPTENTPTEATETPTFKTTLIVYTVDRENFSIDLGTLDETRLKAHAKEVLDGLGTIRIGDGMLVQGSNGVIYIINVDKVTRFELRTN